MTNGYCSVLHCGMNTKGLHNLGLLHIALRFSSCPTLSMQHPDWIGLDWIGLMLPDLLGQVFLSKEVCRQWLG